MSNNAFDNHWGSFNDLISLVEPPALRKKMQQWVNNNINCAYSVKAGSCTMQCLTGFCIYDTEIKIKEIDNDN